MNKVISLSLGKQKLVNLKHKYSYGSLFFLMMVFILISQISYAGSDIQVTGIRKGQNTLNVYTEPSASSKKGAIPVDQIQELSQGKTLEVLDEAINGRYLKVNINGEALWIKAKQVISTQTFDVGSCEKSNAIGGVRGAVNCTK